MPRLTDGNEIMRRLIDALRDGLPPRRCAIRRMERLVQERTSVPVHESAEQERIQRQIHRFQLADKTRAHEELPCTGCAHSASGLPFPGRPSGERPCGFCVRNPDLKDGQEALDWFGERGPMWYDGSTPPWKTPMDCYIATDRSQQQRIFDMLDHYKRSGKPVPPRERYDTHPLSGDPGETWCCEGGDGPSGHTWTCWRWLGISFG
jgi:hypothetical protein